MSISEHLVDPIAVEASLRAEGALPLGSARLMWSKGVLRLVDDAQETHVLGPQGWQLQLSQMHTTTGRWWWARDVTWLIVSLRSPRRERWHLCARFDDTPALAELAVMDHPDAHEVPLAPLMTMLRLAKALGVAVVSARSDVSEMSSLEHTVDAVAVNAGGEMTERPILPALPAQHSLKTRIKHHGVELSVVALLGAMAAGVMLRASDAALPAYAMPLLQMQLMFLAAMMVYASCNIFKHSDREPMGTRVRRLLPRLRLLRPGQHAVDSDWKRNDHLNLGLVPFMMWLFSLMPVLMIISVIFSGLDATLEPPQGQTERGVAHNLSVAVAVGMLLQALERVWGHGRWATDLWLFVRVLALPSFRVGGRRRAGRWLARVSGDGFFVRDVTHGTTASEAHHIVTRGRGQLVSEAGTPIKLTGGVRWGSISDDDPEVRTLVRGARVMIVGQMFSDASGVRVEPIKGMRTIVVIGTWASHPWRALALRVMLLLSPALFALLAVGLIIF